MAAGYLLDSKLISETRKIRADAGVMAFLAAADATRLFLSVLTLGELRKGVEAKRRNDSATADRLGAWVDGIETTFADRVLPVDTPAAALGELSARRTLPVIDTLIAATAITRRADPGYPQYPGRRCDRRPPRRSLAGRVIVAGGSYRSIWADANPAKPHEQRAGHSSGTPALRIPAR